MTMLMHHWLECVGILHQITANMLRLVKDGHKPTAGWLEYLGRIIELRDRAYDASLAALYDGREELLGDEDLNRYRFAVDQHNARYAELCDAFRAAGLM